MPRSVRAFFAASSGQVAGGYALVHDMALANSGAFRDPLIGGFDHLLQIGVGQQAGRDVSPKGADFSAHKFGSLYEFSRYQE